MIPAIDVAMGGFASRTPCSVERNTLHLTVVRYRERAGDAREGRAAG